jgi:hypothetical protein
MNKKLTPEEQEDERLYQLYLAAQSGKPGKPRTVAGDNVSVVAAYLRQNPASVLTLVATGAGVALSIVGGAPGPVTLALAAFAGIQGIGACLRLLKHARRPRGKRNHDLTGGVNLDARVDWRPYENYNSEDE